MLTIIFSVLSDVLNTEQILNKYLLNAEGLIEVKTKKANEFGN